MSTNGYTFKQECEVCGNKPVLKDLGMCSVCTFGEADSLWEWLYEHWEGKELYHAQQYLKQMQRELVEAGMDFAPEINTRVRQLLSFKVRRRQPPKGKGIKA